ncbi:hypothetical protein MARCHEWKA_03320 [Brevundimonas phage vB_BpoS-Marchewka]|uniref:Uncharacterized protein n=1 Tax=Brevundimonas phage vB_BpoS-Marchewka TaxID=2948604 RepID=A0A9E7N5Q9_9CAUD|nr:hypothetical protein MARCHEWKA_03320 [Brevundimonas phage vB_BpoS-Marchewka]
MHPADEIACDAQWSACEPQTPEDETPEEMIFDVRVGRERPISDILKGIPAPDPAVLADPRYGLFRVGVFAGLDEETRQRFVAEGDREMDEHSALCAAQGLDDGFD